MLAVGGLSSPGDKRMLRGCSATLITEEVAMSGIGNPLDNREETMKWIDPAYCDLRLGFEVTAYAYVR